MTRLCSGRARGSGGQQGRKRSREADPSALISGAWPHIHEPVGRHHGLGIMLDHHDRIALVAELLERSYELAVVPLVESYGRFVKYVKYIDELRSDLGREPDSLALTS